METEFLDDTNAGKPESRIWVDATLTRKPENVLLFTLAGSDKLLFFAGTQLSTAHSSSNTKLVEGEGDTLILEKLSEDGKFLYKTVVSKQNWTPLSWSYALTSSGRVIGRIVAEEYRQYPGDIWFPHQLTRYSYSGKTPYVSEKSQLEYVAFNDDVDVKGIKLPPSFQVNDQRFDVPLLYEANDQLLPAEEVQKLLKEERKNEQERKQTTPQKENALAQNTSLPNRVLAPLLGLALIALGCTLWVRSNKSV